MGGDGLSLASKSALDHALEKSRVICFFAAALLFKALRLVLHAAAVFAIGSSFFARNFGAGGLGGLARIIVGMDVTRGLAVIRLEGT